MGWRNAFVLCLTAGAFCSSARAEKVVIVAPTANVMGDNKILGQVRQGTEVTVEKRHGSYILITIPGTQIRGWVNKDATGTMTSPEELSKERSSAHKAFDEAKTDQDKLTAALNLVDYIRFYIQWGERLLQDSPDDAELRKIVNEDRQQLVFACQWIVILRERLGKPDDPLPLLNEIAQVSADLWGRDDYRSVDARLAIVDAQARKVRSAEQQAELQRARQLQSDAQQKLTAKDYAAAAPLAQEAADIRRKVLGAQHPDYAVSLMSTGLAHKGLQDFAAAQPLFEQALRIRKAALGTQHPLYAESVYELAETQLKLGDVDAAERNYTESLRIRRAVYGEVHIDCAFSLLGLTNVCTARKDKEQGQKYLDEADKIIKALAPPGQQ